MKKLCKKCKEYKGLVSFYCHEGKYKSPCKDCRCKAALERSKNEPELKKMYQKAYHKKNYVSRRKSPKIEPWASTLNNRISHRVRKSLDKPLANNITRDNIINASYIMDIYKNQNHKCFYTGIEMDFSNKLTKPSLDRVDSSKGYIEGNVVLCCMGINFMKNDASVEELYNMLNLIKNI